MSAKTRCPTVLWAQRKDKLYLTIDVQDVKNEKNQLENVDGVGKLTFSGQSEGADYALDLTLLHEINVEESKVSVTPRHIFVVIVKVEEGHWERLTKESGKHLSHIKCDWNKWVDEDEEDEKPELDTSGMNFSGFGGGGMGGMEGMMGGMGGMGGMMGGMGGMMGGMGGMEGMDMSALAGLGGDDEQGPGEDEEDSDNDEELPDLVK